MFFFFLIGLFASFLEKKWLKFKKIVDFISDRNGVLKLLNLHIQLALIEQRQM